ncbi:M42 family metallopeptidase [Mycobacterium sp. NAZ190054]|uniref:M42 family metallopeptidase n=1 Tax=Mycobacterium sp. NAZ190054 TaxID=1747766 RepID=UPI0007980804|nr:M20/M25/M40 family metallo-hydrolase [Mycobacterium sp. NAZ190054]KWX68473.1 peptidase M42 [Mycobacterium sp. NAZ190054]
MSGRGQAFRDLLQELLATYGPCGQEDAVRDVCRRELAPLVDDSWVDPAGNLVGVIRGGDGPPVRAMAHMDELSMLVKRIDEDGTLHLTPLGTMYPANFGLGPVALLGEHETLCGVLALGSEHTTQETPRIWQTKPDQGDKALDWPDVYVFTGLHRTQLREAGVSPGTRVCVHQSKRTLIDIAGHLGCYFLDDRAAVTALLCAVRELRAGRAPAGDVYVVFTTNEELGGLGGSYASRTLPGDLTLAIEVGPAEPEYGTTLDGGPIVAYSDAECVYDKAVADRLVGAAEELGLAPQPAVLGAFESDASHAKAGGLSAQAGLVCLPTLSTHGYEVIAGDAIPATATLLARFLGDPGLHGVDVHAQR